MKKLLTAAFTLALALLLGVSALADVAYEPQDDFYRRHYQECYYVNKDFYISGPAGYAIGFSSPTGTAKVALPNNGLLYYVSYFYTDADGVDWGFIEYDKETLRPGYSESAWFPVGQLLMDYDSDSFFADHADEIRSEQRTLDIQFRYDVTIYGYKYPGSGIVRTEISDARSMSDVVYYQIYTDSAGRDWGYVGYYYGYRDFWVCLDDPTNDALEPDENQVNPKTVPAADEATMAAALKEAKSVNYTLLAGAVGIVIIALCLLLSCCGRSRAKRKSQTES